MARPPQELRDPLAGMIVHEDPDLLVVNKPSGLLTASGPRDRRKTLWGIVQMRAVAFQKLRRPMGLIHRLDRDACGLLVFSKNDQAYQSLKKQFFRHTVERTYMAIVRGMPKSPEGTIENRLAEWKDGTVHPTRHRAKGEVAISHYQVHSVSGDCSLVRVRLETGRKHQIRVHLAGMGCPIVGDHFYGEPQADASLTLMLCAIRLCFDHPRSGKRMEFEIPLPQHMRTFLRTLRRTDANSTDPN